MRNTFLVGSQIYLRALEAEDARGPYLEWLGDHGVTRFLGTGVFPTSVSALEKYISNITESPDNVMLAIVEAESGAHVGNIKLGPIKWVHRRADLGVLIGDKRCWGRRYGLEAVLLMLDYGFARLNLHKITLGVEAEHLNAVRLYEGVGFRVEGTLKDHLFREGAFHDNLVMGLLRSEYAKTHRASPS